MIKHAQDASYVIRHNAHVFLAACRLGVLVRGLLHDWSKLPPDEWIPYAEYFYGWMDADVADWIGAGRALGKPDTAARYAANRDRMVLGPETRRWIEHELAEMARP